MFSRQVHVNLRWSLCLFLLLSSAAQNLADNGWEGQVLAVADDNDALVGTDRHYTQGARISYLSRDDALPRWLQSFSSFLPNTPS